MVVWSADAHELPTLERQPPVPDGSLVVGKLVVVNDSELVQNSCVYPH